MRKALVKKGFALLILVFCFTLAIVGACFAADKAGGGASFNVTGQEHPGFANQPAGNKMIGKAVWQVIKPFAFGANILDNLFKGNFGTAVKQLATAPVNYAVSVGADAATAAMGDTKVYAGPDNPALRLP